MAARGERSARAAQIATLETRRRKAQDVPIERLRAEWRARAAEHGLDRTRLQYALAQRGATEEVAADFEQISRRLESPEGLTREATRFTRRDVVQAFAGAARQGERVHQIEALADAFLQRPTVVRLERDHGDGDVLHARTARRRTSTAGRRRRATRHRRRRRRGAGDHRRSQRAAQPR